MKQAALFIGLAVLAAPAAAQSMNASTFLARAEALKKKGPLALLSSDLKLLRAEIQGSAEQLRAERLAAAKAGAKPAYCPPAKATPMSPDEIIGHFRSIPPQQRARMTTREGFKLLMVKKYPCRA